MAYELGVDLGTTYSTVAINRDGHIEMADVGAHSFAVPSVIYVASDGRVLVGEVAQRRAATDPTLVAREVKRRLGDTAPVLVGSNPYPATLLTAALLRGVVNRVIRSEGEAPRRVMLAHPANWGRFRLDVFAEAAAQSGIETTFSYVAEPLAAAIWHARQERVPTGAVVAVYDLGGGTFDTAVLRKTERSFEVLGEPLGLERLGGLDFDELIVTFIDGCLDGALRRLDPTSDASARTMRALRDEVVLAKETLSTDIAATVDVALPDGLESVRITRRELNEMIEPLVAQTLALLQATLDLADVAVADLHKVLLVGGSSRVPLVAEMIERQLGVAAALDEHPKNAIALGAAAALLQTPASSGPATAFAPPPPEPDRAERAGRDERAERDVVPAGDERWAGVGAEVEDRPASSEPGSEPVSFGSAPPDGGLAAGPGDTTGPSRSGSTSRSRPAVGAPAVEAAPVEPAPAEVAGTEDVAGGARAGEIASGVVLVVATGPDSGRTVPLVEGVELTVGRDEPSQLLLHDPRVSRQHARLRWSGEHIEVEDLRSSNRSFVDGEPIERTTIVAGQALRMGNTVVVAGRAGPGHDPVAGSDEAIDPVVLPAARGGRLRRAREDDRRDHLEQLEALRPEIVERRRLVAAQRRAADPVAAWRAVTSGASRGRGAAGGPRVTVGLGDAPTALGFLAPELSDEARADTHAFLAPYRVDHDVPIVVGLDPGTVVDLAGPAEAVAGAAREIAVQLLTGYDPGALRVAILDAAATGAPHGDVLGVPGARWQAFPHTRSGAGSLVGGLEVVAGIAALAGDADPRPLIVLGAVDALAGAWFPPATSLVRIGPGPVADLVVAIDPADLLAELSTVDPARAAVVAASVVGRFLPSTTGPEAAAALLDAAR